MAQSAIIPDYNSYLCLMAALFKQNWEDLLFEYEHALEPVLEACPEPFKAVCVFSQVVVIAFCFSSLYFALKQWHHQGVAAQLSCAASALTSSMTCIAISWSGCILSSQHPLVIVNTHTCPHPSPFWEAFPYTSPVPPPPSTRCRFHRVNSSLILKHYSVLQQECRCYLVNASIQQSFSIARMKRFFLFISGMTHCDYQVVCCLEHSFLTFTKPVTNQMVQFRPNVEMAEIMSTTILWVEAYLKREQGCMTHYPTTSGSWVVYTFYIFLQPWWS